MKTNVKKQLGHHAGTVLLRLEFWIRFNVKKGRQPSTAIGMEQIAEECDLSFFQAKRAVAKLRREGLIRSEQRQFGIERRNLNVYVLTSAGEAMLGAPLQQTSSAPLREQTTLAPLEQSSFAPLYSTDETTQYNADEHSSPQPLRRLRDMGIPFPPWKGSPSPKPPPQNFEVEMPSHSVHDVQAMLAAQKKVHKPESGDALAQVWKVGMKEHLPGQLVTLSVKDVGRLKTFAKQHCAPGTAEAVLQFILAEWIGFTKFCEQEKGAYKTPGTPTIPFLQNFGQQAVTFWLQNQKKPAMAVQSVNSSPLITQLIALQEPVPPTVTLDDVLAPFDPDADHED